MTRSEGAVSAAEDLATTTKEMVTDPEDVVTAKKYTMTTPETRTQAPDESIAGEVPRFARDDSVMNTEPTRTDGDGTA